MIEPWIMRMMLSWAVEEHGVWWLFRFTVKLRLIDFFLGPETGSEYIGQQLPEVYRVLQIEGKV